MNKAAVITASIATLAAVLHGASASGKDGGSSGTWPADLPLPTNPGTVTAQSPTDAVVRSTDSVAVVRAKLDELYVAQKGCTLKLAVNRPKDYLCFNPATKKTDEVVFTFAALDPTATDPAASQTNAFYLQG
jgi:hypothetical protein